MKRPKRLELLEKPRLDEQTIALRVAREFEDGMIVNLGFGIPGLAVEFVPLGREVLFHSENGMLGYGPIASPEEEDFNLVNASSRFVTRQPGMSFFDHNESFAIIRGGHVDLSVMGGMQVSKDGDLVNWVVPGKKVGNVGGSMDLACGARKQAITMTHVTKNGEFKVVEKCTYPLTAPRCVDLIITDIAVIEVTKEGLVLKEVAPGWTSEEVQELTEPELIVSADLEEMRLA